MGNQVQNAVKIIQIIFTDFVITEMCLPNPWKSPAEPQDFAKQSTSGLVGISKVWFEGRCGTLIQINENPTRGGTKTKGRGVDKNIVDVF
jgi:hypothetical protein